MIALYPPSLNRGQSGAELLNTDRKQVADGLAGLPRGYGDLAPKPAPPKLGPPLPGDLGPPVTHVEQNLGIPPQPAQNFGLRPNPEEDANRAERMRLARQAQRCSARRRWPSFAESQTTRSARRSRCFVVRRQGRQLMEVVRCLSRTTASEALLRRLAIVPR